ncbi:MAG: glycerol-3-phosphate acyltransferase [Anaerolineae bacterium]
MANVMAVVASYLLGSLPFAYLITRLATGKDIRQEGDGNGGARNVMHVAGLGAGLLTLALDAGKGAATAYVVRRWAASDLGVCLAGISLVLGHGYPVWLGWLGGKGLGAAAGYFLLRWPYATLVSLVTLVAAHAAIQSFSVAVAVSAAAFLMLSLVEGNTPAGVASIVAILATTGVKHILDLPRERALRPKDTPLPGGSL